MNPEPPPFALEWLARYLRTTSESAVLLIDPEGAVLAWLGAAERLFGYPAAEAQGMNFERLFIDRDRRLGLHRQEIDAALASGRSEDDRWHQRQDGSRFWATGVLEAIRNDDGSVAALCKTVRDRTDLRTRIDALRNSLFAREQEHDERTNFIVSVGHELRNLVGPAQNAASLIALSDDPAMRNRSLEILQRQLTAMSMLLDDLGRASETAGERLRLERQPVIVQDAVRQAVDAMRATIERNGQQLRATLPPVPFTIEADALRVQQMLLNLLGNASKYTPAGGHIDVTASVEADMAVIRVADDGIGIDPQVLPHIFELFTRDASRTTQPGLGVGLAVVKELATLHGGGIEARSLGPGKGSLFALRLPLDVARRPEPPPG